MLRVVKYVLLVILVLLVCGVGYYIFVDAWGGSTVAESEETVSGGTLEDLERKATERLLHEEQSRHDEATARDAEALSLAKVRNIEATGKLKDAHDAVADLKAAVSAWEHQTSNLETNSDGRWIGADPASIQTYLMTVESVELLQGKEQAQRIERVINSAIAPVIERPLTATYQVSDALLEQLASQRQNAVSLTKKYRQATDTIRNLIAHQRQAGATASGTLQEAIQAFHMANTKAIKAEAHSRLADLRQKEVERIEQDARDEAQHEQLVREAQSQETKRLLAFFLTPGEYDHKTKKNIHVLEKKPVSFSLLEQRGALEHTKVGISRFLYIACDDTDKIRPHWPNHWFGYWRGRGDVRWETLTEANRELIKNAQDKLKKLGPTLVELEMMAP